MGLLEKFNVTVSGPDDGRPLMFAHGFGCDQVMWRDVVPHFEADHRIVLFDLAGCGGAAAAYDVDRYADLSGYAADVNDILDALGVDDVVFVGHSVSSMIGVVASNDPASRIGALVLVGPSPRYIDDGDYVGGFGRSDIEELLESLDSNYLGWSASMAPVIMGNPDRPELGQELEESFCRVDPAVARRFARVTFLSDNRDDLAKVDVPTAVLQCARDAIAPPVVGDYVHDRIAGSVLEVLDVSGHCPNLSAPDLTAAAIRRFLEGRAAPA